MKVDSLFIIKFIIIIDVIITFTIAQPTIIRCCHGSAMVNDKIYIGGGVTGPVGEDVWTDDFFSLDLTKPFSTLSPNDMPYEVHAKVPVKSRTHALVYAKNAKGGMIYLFGGHRQPPEGNPIYGYDIDINAWSSISPEVRDSSVKIPVNSTSKVIGLTDSSLDIVYIFDNGTMFIYDAFRDFWDTGRPAPFMVLRYAAVMLDTGEILYIGGSNGTVNIPMDQILIYNTKSSLWYIKTAKAIDSGVPSPRVGHTASMAPDGRIFIYGGFDGDEDSIDAPGSTPTFAVLEYIDNDFEWFSPQLYNQSYVMRIFHTSHIYENYLIIAFGRNLTHSRLNTMDLIDISNKDSYTVVTDFIPDNYVPPTTASSTQKTLSKTTAIIIASVFSAVGMLIIIGAIFFLIKCLRKQQEAIPTPGGDDERYLDLPSTPGSIHERNSSDNVTTRTSDFTTRTSDLTTRTNDPYRMPRYSYQSNKPY